AVIVAVALAAWYLHAVRSVRLEGASWPVRRTAIFIAGLAVFIWTTCGWLEVYRSSLFWAWTAQILTLMLIVPLVILAGHPLQLARIRSGDTGWVDRFLRAAPGKFLP